LGEGQANSDRDTRRQRMMQPDGRMIHASAWRWKHNLETMPPKDFHGRHGDLEMRKQARPRQFID
jgi:hypothetical protein